MYRFPIFFIAGRIEFVAHPQLGGGRDDAQAFLVFQPFGGNGAGRFAFIQGAPRTPFFLFYNMVLPPFPVMNSVSPERCFPWNHADSGGRAPGAVFRTRSMLPPQNGAEQDGGSIGHAAQAKGSPPEGFGTDFIDHVPVKIGLSYPEEGEKDDDVAPDGDEQARD